MGGNKSVETRIELLEKNDIDLAKSIDLVDKKVDQIQNNQRSHADQSQKQHLENIGLISQLKETLLVNFGTIKEYIDLKVKEHKIEIDKEYAKKIDHNGLSNRVEKIESVFSWAWKIVFWFIIVGILAVLFGKQ